MKTTLFTAALLLSFAAASAQTDSTRTRRVPQDTASTMRNPRNPVWDAGKNNRNAKDSRRRSDSTTTMTKGKKRSQRKR